MRLAVPALLAAGLAAPGALAAPVAGPAGEAFYTPPTSVPASGPAGELIWYRPATLNLGAGTPSSTSWQVLYRSRDSAGNPNFVSGTVIQPRATFPGTRPVVSYAFGTQGLAKACAPSRQLVAGTEYEAPNLIAALKQNYTVAASDYAGYTTGGKPSYLAGKSQGQAALDVIKAAKQIPNTGISQAARSVVWGYSQGGQTAGWAGELASTYAPDVNLAAVAAGGVPGDFITSAKALNAAEGAAFLLGGVIGLSQEYPQGIPFDDLANAAGQTARTEALAGGCVFKLLNQYRNADIQTFVKNGQTLDQLLQIPSVQATLAAQTLGTKKIDVPVYQWHGAADEFLPLGQAYQLKKNWCAKGTSVDFDLYPSEHLASQFQAAPYVLDFFEARLSGRAVTNSCGTTKPSPTSTADAPGGDFIVNLDRWKLSGSTKLAKLNQTIVLPEGGTFSGSTNLTKKTLTGGQVSIPSFYTNIDILGAKVRTALTLTPTGPVEGTASLDDNGYLHLDAIAPVSLGIRSLAAFGITFGTNCRTSGPLRIPVKYDGPVSALGTGQLTSRTTATIPNLVNCGAYGPLLSTLIASTGNGFVLTETAPDPVQW